MQFSDAGQAVVVIIGSGGTAVAVARRIGSGCRIILADWSESSLHVATTRLTEDGHNVKAHQVDISDMESVQVLVEEAGANGNVSTVVVAAGLGPSKKSAEQIFEVDLKGTANLIEAFREIITPRGAMVCIASMAGHTIRSKLTPGLENHLATAPLDRLLAHPELELFSQNSGTAFSVARRANQLRVEFAALAYGSRNCRINSISPGVVFPMGSQTVDHATEGFLWSIARSSPARRQGTVDDIANAVEFLCSQRASFITGTDLLVDGGAVARRHVRAAADSSSGSSAASTPNPTPWLGT